MPQGSPDVFAGIAGLGNLESTDEEHPASDGSKVSGNGVGGDVPSSTELAVCLTENNLGESTVQVHGDNSELSKRSSILHERPPQPVRP